MQGRLKLSKVLHMRLAASSKPERGWGDEDYDTYWRIYCDHHRETEKPPLRQVTASNVCSSIN